eukprot:7502575-Heterocapsa_arctica.AAC.1
MPDTRARTNPRRHRTICVDIETYASTSNNMHRHRNMCENNYGYYGYYGNTVVCFTLTLPRGGGRGG